MFWFKRERTRAGIQADTGLPVTNPGLLFEIDLGRETSAELMARHLDERFKLAIRKLARDSYEQGYRDGRNHQANNPPWPSRLDP